MSGSYRDLRVWQEARKLTVHIYKVTDRFPKHELYGLTGQLRRAAVSVASNIAEGKGHQTDKEFLKFLFHARGSLLEAETQIILSRELQYCSEEEADSLLKTTAKLGGLLTGLVNSLRGQLSFRRRVNSRSGTATI